MSSVIAGIGSQLEMPQRRTVQAQAGAEATGAEEEVVTSVVRASPEVREQHDEVRWHHVPCERHADTAVRDRIPVATRTVIAPQGWMHS